MTFHPEILGRRQHRALTRLGPVLTARGFYLGGGTALALHLGHRRSVDLDWFTAERLGSPLRLGRELRDDGIAWVTGQTAPGTLYGTVAGVRVSFFEYRYPLLKPTILWRPGRCRLASRADLTAMKLAAVAQRGAKKDFIDLYALARAGVSLRQAAKWYRRKYDVADVAHLLYGLAYFDEADRERMPRMLWDADWRTVKGAIRDWLRDLST
jgi:hypothetical protein